MKQLVIIIALYLFCFTCAQTQSVQSIRNFSPHASQIFVEGLGSGVLYSINYDRRFGNQENGLGLRIGASGYKGDDGNKYSTMPFQINYLLGDKGKYFEIGLGATYGEGNIDTHKTGDFIGTAVLGYRRQPYEKKGITWRIALTPLIVFEPNNILVLPWIGASIGFRF